MLPPKLKILLLSFSCFCITNSACFATDISLASSPRQVQGVTLNTLFDPGKTRYSFLHMQEFLPSITIYRGDKPVIPLLQSTQKLGNVEFSYIQPSTKKVVNSNLEKMLLASNTDGLVVLKNGQIVAERYFNGQDATTRHQMNSVSKSIFGSITASLIAEGKLKRDAKVSEYIPELKDSAFGDATVDQVMNMTVGVKYSEDYLSPDSEIARYINNMGLRPGSAPYNDKLGIRSFLTELKKEQQHGTTFLYATPVTDVVCWLAERASGQSPSKLLEERVWQKMGMERDAYVLVDPQGTPSCGAGVNATARDLSRFGQMLLQKGKFNHQQILPSQVVEHITKGGDPIAYKNSVYVKGGAITPEGSSYVDQFWFFNYPEKSYSAWGIYGQFIYVDPKNNVVIVQQSSQDLPEDHDIEAQTLAAFRAIAASLK